MFSRLTNAKIFPYVELMRLNKPIGIYLLLWPTLIALWVASSGNPSSKLIVVFTLGVILTRSAGCVINDFADRNFDSHVERSKNRPLATKKISIRIAFFLFFSLLFLALILVLQTNLLTTMFASVAVALMVVYPFMKRYTHAPQLFLGLAYAWGVPMAFAAQTNEVNLSSFWLFGFVVVWAIVYDTMYAMVDKVDDLKIGIKSSAILFAPYEQICIGVLQVLMLGCLLMTGLSFQMPIVYYLGLLTVIPFIIYQQCLIKDCNTKLCFKAFLNNHWLGLVLFIVTAVSYW